MDISFTEAKQVNWNDELDRPSANDLHLWNWDTQSTGLDRTDWLDAHEQHRYSKLATAELRDNFLAAHAGLRLILGKYLDCEPAAVEFERTPLGKPQLADGPLQFNTSHSGKEILLAVSGEHVGVDVERVRPVTRLSALAAKHFTQLECTSLDVLPNDEQRLHDFFQTWTRKEAVVKLTGLGLRAGVRNLDTLESQHATEIPTEWDTPLKHCWLGNITLRSGYLAAVAMSEVPSPVRLLQLGRA